MALLNYSTSIKAEKTVGEIQKMLAMAGAQAVLSEYDNEGVVSSMSFRINTQHGVVFFKMPARTDGVLRRLISENKVPRRLKTKEQAANVAWRILKDWVEAQLAIVDTEMAEIAEVFLPYAQDSTGKTVYEKFEAGKLKELTHQP